MLKKWGLPTKGINPVQWDSKEVETVHLTPLNPIISSLKKLKLECY